MGDTSRLELLLGDRKEQDESLNKRLRILFEEELEGEKEEPEPPPPPVSPDELPEILHYVAPLTLSVVSDAIALAEQKYGGAASILITPQEFRELIIGDRSSTPFGDTIDPTHFTLFGIWANAGHGNAQGMVMGIGAGSIALVATR